MVKAYWYRRVPNFGDLLTEWLLAKYGIEAEWAPPRRAEFVGVGSILQALPPRWSGTVWGAGHIKHRATLSAHILALRGPLTGEAPLYADPGLLAGRDVSVTAEHPTGVIAHYIAPLAVDGHQIDVQADPDTVIREAAKCERITSSSLHGLIVADSLGIPNRWIHEPRVVGDGFKFRDYAAAFGETIEPGVWRLAPQDQVAEKQERLVECLMSSTSSARATTTPSSATRSAVSSTSTTVTFGSSVTGQHG